MGRRTIYIGSFTTGAGGTGEGITVTAGDNDTGKLTADRLVARVDSPAFLARHPEQPWLYAVSERAEGAVVGYAINDGGDLTELGTSPTGGGGTCHLTVDPSGTCVLTANYRTGTLSVHPIGDDGAPGERTDTIQHDGSGPDPDRQEGPHAHQVRVDPSGRWVLAVDLGMDAICAYTLDTTAGRLIPGQVSQLHPGSGPRHLVFGTDGLVYVAGELDCTVTVLSLDADTGALESIGVAPSLIGNGGTDGRTYPSEIAMSGDGRFLYVANRGADVIGTLAVNGRSIRPVGDVPTGGNWPRHLAVIGDHLYVANERSHQVTVFTLDADTGLPRPTGDVLDVPSPACILPA